MFLPATTRRRSMEAVGGPYVVTQTDLCRVHAWNRTVPERRGSYSKGLPERRGSGCRGGTCCRSPRGGGSRGRMCCGPSHGQEKTAGAAATAATTEAGAAKAATGARG